MGWFHAHIDCKMIVTIRLVNTSIPFIITLFTVMILLEMYSLNNSQVHSAFVSFLSSLLPVSRGQCVGGGSNAEIWAIKSQEKNPRLWSDNLCCEGNMCERSHFLKNYFSLCFAPRWAPGMCQWPTVDKLWEKKNGSCWSEEQEQGKGTLKSWKVWGSPGEKRAGRRGSPTSGSEHQTSQVRLWAAEPKHNRDRI